MSGGSTNDTETARQSWKPDRVTVLFVGESPPASETFFYHGDSNLYRYTKEAFEATFDEHWPTPEDFLAFFRDRGCYLVDLYPDASSVQTCADPLDVSRVAREIRSAAPKAVIVVVKRVENEVWRAVCESGTSPAVFRSLPFPGHGWQRKYVSGLRRLLKEVLPSKFLAAGANERVVMDVLCDARERDAWLTSSEVIDRIDGQLEWLGSWRDVVALCALEMLEGVAKVASRKRPNGCHEWRLVEAHLCEQRLLD